MQKRQTEKTGVHANGADGLMRLSLSVKDVKNQCTKAVETMAQVDPYAPKTVSESMQNGQMRARHCTKLQSTINT